MYKYFVDFVQTPSSVFVCTRLLSCWLVVVYIILSTKCCLCPAVRLLYYSQVFLHLLSVQSRRYSFFSFEGSKKLIHQNNFGLLSSVFLGLDVVIFREFHSLYCARTVVLQKRLWTLYILIRKTQSTLCERTELAFQCLKSRSTFDSENSGIFVQYRSLIISLKYSKKITPFFAFFIISTS